MTAGSYLPNALLLVLALALPAYCADSTFSLENTNFVIRQPDISDTTDYTFDYNRLRLSSRLSSQSFFITAIGDWVNFLGKSFVTSDDFSYMERVKADIPFDIRTQVFDYDGGATFLKIHRLYGGYEAGRQRITVGIQKISMGVGRIWTPTDLYNPRNAYSLEPDEVKGVLAANYVYSPSDLSTMNAVISIRKDNSIKYAARFKGYLSFADAGADLIVSDDTIMAGFELEGNLFDTGIEWRSEGGWFHNDPLDAKFFQGIIGADYGFENGLTMAVECLYSSETFGFHQILVNYENEIINNMVMANFYAGASLYYDFNIALSGSLLYIESFYHSNSRFIAPTLTYTFNDHHLFDLGAQFNIGSSNSEFGPFGNTFYLKWKASY